MGCGAFGFGFGFAAKREAESRAEGMPEGVANPVSHVADRACGSRGSRRKGYWVNLFNLIQNRWGKIQVKVWTVPVGRVGRGARRACPSACPTNESTGFHSGTRSSHAGLKCKA